MVMVMGFFGSRTELEHPFSSTERIKTKVKMSAMDFFIAKTSVTASTTPLPTRNFEKIEKKHEFFSNYLPKSQFGVGTKPKKSVY